MTSTGTVTVYPKKYVPIITKEATHNFFEGDHIWLCKTVSVQLNVGAEFLAQFLYKGE